MPAKTPVISWAWPKETFERVHIDFFSFKNETYLLLIDGHSKWIEVILMKTTTAGATIIKLKEIFARFGLPEKLVSDNGPPFSSVEFKDFLDKNGIEHKTSAPYHPASNGEAENAVRIIKKALKKADFENIAVNSFLQRFLLDYRNSVHCTTGETPARLMLGRPMRTRIELLKTGLKETVTDKLKQRACRKGGTVRQWEDGDSVWARDYRIQNKWVSAKITKRLGINMYEVQSVADNRLRWSRHADQLRSRIPDEPTQEALAPGHGQQIVNPAGEKLMRSKRSSILVSAQAALDDCEDTGRKSDDDVSSLRERRPVRRYGIDDLF